MSTRVDLLITQLNRCQSRVFCVLLWGSNPNSAFPLCSVEFGWINRTRNPKRSKATLFLNRVWNFGVANLWDDSIELSRSFAYSTYQLWRMEKNSNIHAESFPRPRKPQLPKWAQGRNLSQQTEFIKIGPKIIRYHSDRSFSPFFSIIGVDFIGIVCNENCSVRRLAIPKS